MRTMLGVGCLWLCALGMCFAQIQVQNQQIEKIGPNVRPPVPIDTPEAVMPDAARAQRINGICLVSIVVDAKGNTTNAHLVRCSNPIFDANTIASVSKYRFKPAVRVSDGTTVPVMLKIEVAFRRLDVSFDPDELWAPLLIQYSFLSPPGITSMGPDANNVYPLSKLTTQPEFARVDNVAAGRLVKSFKNGFDCHLTITLNAKGQPSDPGQPSCDDNAASAPVKAFLMSARYRPAELSGSRVAVRILVHFTNAGRNNLDKLDAQGNANASVPKAPLAGDSKPAESTPH